MLELLFGAIMISAFVGLFVGIMIGSWCCKEKEYEDKCCIHNYDMYLKCDKLFITNHYQTLADYNIVDLSDYIKKGIIRVDCGRTRPAESGETHGRTQLYAPAAVRKLKGEDVWEYVEL